MKKACFLLFSFLAFTAATCEKVSDNTGCIDEKLIDEDAVCIEIYKPVCGCDGKTYSNDCYAGRAGLTRWEEGACED